MGIMHIRAGKFLTEQELDECISFLQEQGAVQYFKTARQRLKSALITVTLTEGPNLVGMGVIKDRSPKYNEKISERSGYPLHLDMCEIGYIGVAEACRGQGLATQIVKQLLKYEERIYATTSNLHMMYIFRREGFYPQGHPWRSKEGKELTLWVKQ